jgi:hypothetical protein
MFHGFRLTRKTLQFAAILAIALSPVLVLNEVAEGQTDPLRLGVVNNNQVFLTPDSARNGGTFTLSLIGGTAASIQVSLVDIFADQEGQRRALPLNSNPYSANELVVFSSSLPDYIPNGQVQTFEIPFRFKDPEAISRPVLGGLKISVVDLTQDEEQSIVTPSIVATFAYFPNGEATSDFNPSLELSNLSISTTVADTFPWSLVPNIPNVFSSSELLLNADLLNSGDLFLSSKVQIYLFSVDALGQRIGEGLKIAESKSSLLLPSQLKKESVLLFQTEESPASSDLIGLYWVDVQAAGYLDAEVIAEDQSSTLVLIFPWKPLTISAIVVFLMRKKILQALRFLKVSVADRIDQRGAQGPAAISGLQGLSAESASKSATMSDQDTVFSDPVQKKKITERFRKLVQSTLAQQVFLIRALRKQAKARLWNRRVSKANYEYEKDLSARSIEFEKWREQIRESIYSETKKSLESPRVKSTPGSKRESKAAKSQPNLTTISVNRAKSSPGKRHTKTTANPKNNSKSKTPRRKAQ